MQAYAASFVIYLTIAGLAIADSLMKQESYGYE